MSYYHRYGHQLPISCNIGPPSSNNNSIKSESGVRSPIDHPFPTSQVCSNTLPLLGNNSTIHPPNNTSVDPTNYYPTPNVSAALEDSTLGNYNKEIAGLCNSISQLTHDVPLYEEQRGNLNVPLTMKESTKLSENLAYDPYQRITPVKFCTPHVKAAFSARGLLAKVDAKSPLDGQSGRLLMLITMICFSCKILEDSTNRINYNITNSNFHNRTLQQQLSYIASK